MDLSKSGRLLFELRKAKGMTQKQVADRLGVLPKTVSKWETGKGFPDICVISDLADILGINERVLLGGDLIKNEYDAGNVKKTRFFVCPHCGSIVHGMGNFQITCCTMPVEPLMAKNADDEHGVNISEIENDFYIEFNHEMTKEHFISFVSYVGVDRVITVKLYPQQAPTVRFPVMYGGKFYFYCNKHGLFEYKKNKLPRYHSR